jgi:hypothetical protein
MKPGGQTLRTENAEKQVEKHPILRLTQVYDVWRNKSIKIYSSNYKCHEPGYLPFFNQKSEKSAFFLTPHRF